MGRILALDVGDVRIGLALSDLMGIIASPLETYTRTKNVECDMDYILAICKAKEVDTIICGLPKSLNNADSIQTQKVRDFAKALSEKTAVKIVFVDERLSTVAAQKILMEGNVRREDRKKSVDKIAAAIILETYLSTKK